MNSSSSIPNPRSPILCIVGPTASGKSALAMDVAKQFDGEIICADSQTIRRDLDIGTAKPSIEDQHEVPHHMLDIIDPYDTFSAAEFKRQAEKHIEDIKHRGKLPIVVGGTGLYIDAVLFDFSFKDKPNELLRSKLNVMSIEELQQEIANRGLTLPADDQNPRRLIRVIESGGAAAEKAAMRADAVVIGIEPGKDVLNERIHQRIAVMIEQGFLNEVKSVLQKYGLPPAQVDAIGYNIALQHRSENGQFDEAKIIEEFEIADRQYAKRQRAWFKRNKEITWFEHPKDAYNYISELLAHVS